MGTALFQKKNGAGVLIGANNPALLAILNQVKQEIAKMWAPNTARLITESGVFTAPVSSLYVGLIFSGGRSAAAQPVGATGGWLTGIAGSSYLPRPFAVYLEKGEEVPVVIGAGGIAPAVATGVSTVAGGASKFGDIENSWDAMSALLQQESVPYWGGELAYSTVSTESAVYAIGGGYGGGYPAQPQPDNSQAERNELAAGVPPFGGGGSLCILRNNNNPLYAVGNGAQGSIFVCWFESEETSSQPPAEDE